jgi:hypothetical protein
MDLVVLGGGSASFSEDFHGHDGPQETFLQSAIQSAMVARDPKLPETLALEGSPPLPMETPRCEKI